MTGCIRRCCRIACCASGLLLPFAATVPGTDSMSIPVGLKFENNYDFQVGLKAAFADKRILNEHPRLSLSYTTSRLATAFGSNALEKDIYLLGLGWYFRPSRMIDPYIIVATGFTHYDREDDEMFALLDNNAGILSVDLGLELGIFGGLVRPWFEFGYSIFQSSTVYPIVFSFGLDYDIAKGLLR
jgi:hypothetical protein